MHIHICIYVYIYIYIYGNVPLIRDKENMIKGDIRVFRANTFNIFEIIIQIGMFERPGCRKSDFSTQHYSI